MSETPINRRHRPNSPPRPDGRSQRIASALDRQREARHARFQLSRDELDGFDGLEIDAEPGGQSSSKRKARKWTRFADKLMYAELLDLSDGLPTGPSWICVGPVPRGRRVLVLSTGQSTIALARKTGRPVAHLHTALPNDSIMDAIYDRERSVLWVLDLFTWSSMPVSDSTAEFRLYWRDAKLAELSQAATDPRSALLVPIPTLASPSSASLLDSIAACAQPGVCDVRTTSGTRQVKYEPDGLLFYVAEGIVESGPSCLAGWVPLDRLDALAQLCREDASMET